MANTDNTRRCFLIVGTTAPATPAAVQLLKLQAQQRTRSANAPEASPDAGQATEMLQAEAEAAAAAAAPPRTLSPVIVHSQPPPNTTRTGSADRNLSRQLDAFEALTSPLAAAVAADAYEEMDDDDYDVSDAVELLRTRQNNRSAGQPKAQQGEAKLVDADAQARAALARGASAKALAMAKKLDELSVEHADLARELSTNE